MSIPKSRRFTVFIKFDSRGKIVIDGNEITISLRSIPKGGRANQELIKKLADYFVVNTDGIRIVAGRTSKKKLVEVSSQEIPESK